MRYAIFLTAGLITGALFATTVGAQQIAFDGLKADRNAPVEVTSEALNVDQQTGTAVFNGDVLVVQGGMRMKAQTITVNYDQNDRSRITTMNATGGVTLVSPSEAAESKDAMYDIDAGQILMTGDVVVTQGTSVMSGQKLTVNLTNGTGQMDGRVRTILQPRQESRPQ